MRRAVSLALLTAVAALAAATLTVPVANADFGFMPGAVAEATKADASPETQAGAVPFIARTKFEMNSTTTGDGASYMTLPDGNVRNITVDLPAGMIGDPKAAPRCPRQAMIGAALNFAPCPASTQVGTITLHFGSNNSPAPTPEDSLFEHQYPVYNMVPRKGDLAQFTFVVFGFGPTNIIASVRPDDFGIRTKLVNISAAAPMVRSDLELWGVPADPVHDADRGKVCLQGFCLLPGGQPSGVEPRPFLRLPTTCDGSEQVTSFAANSWQNPSNWDFTSAAAPAVTGCERLSFTPTMDIQPTGTSADAPTGLNVDIGLPQPSEPDVLAAPHLKDVKVTLPEGMSINPSGADGVVGCSDAQLKLGSAEAVECPGASRIGTVQATSPTLDETLSGGVFLRSQASDVPESGDMYRLALVLESAERGLSIRLPGAIRVDSASGRVVAEFANNPQLPVSNVNLRLKTGPRAALATPMDCGAKTANATLTSWAGHSVEIRSAFEIDCAPGGRGFAPSFAAGTVSPTAGETSTFSLALARKDGEKEFGSIRNIRLPEGLLGAVGSVPLCADAQAAAGTCADASRIGHVQIAAGAGSAPLWIPGAGKSATGVYLTGPYKGAPYGLSIKVPAQAGPFDLGTVVVRSALHVDDRTTAITTGIDESRLIERDGSVTAVLPGELPRILKGVVLRQREIRVIMDREGFMVNPTDCSAMQISADAIAADGQVAAVSNRFRAADCARLGFAPRFRAQILNKGRKSTLRSFHPRTRFTVVPRTGDANIGAARVVLPSSTLLDQANIGTTCTRVQMAANDCPVASVVGHARAWSPLLQRPVQGPVYLAANGGVRPLPDLVAVMDGEIQVRLMGEISTLRRGGTARLQNTFRVVPDAPVSRFVLTMRGGNKRGLLVNSTDLCRTNERGVAVFHGQNGRAHRLRPRIATSFKGCAKVRRRAARKMAQRKTARQAAAAVRKAMR